MLAFAVARAQQAAKAGSEFHAEVQVAVLLMTYRGDATLCRPARAEDLEPLGVVDAIEDPRGARTSSPSSWMSTLR